jgi:thioredoxin 1
MQIVTSEELEQMKFRGEKVLADFYADWCGPCKMLIPRLERMETDFPDVKFVKVNVDHNRDYSMDMGIRSVPTIMFFEGSKMIGQSTGAQSDDFYKKYLSQLNENNG